MALWTPIQHDTFEKPEVHRLASAIGCSAHEALGLAVLFWIWCDTHCHPINDGADADGLAPGVTPEQIDFVLRRAPGATSVARALESVGWARFTDDGLVCPRYMKHMGKRAKERMKNTLRQASLRAAKRDSDEQVAHEARQPSRSESDTPEKPARQPSRMERDAGATPVAPRGEERRDTTTTSVSATVNVPGESPSGGGGDPAGDGGWLAFFRDRVGVGDAKALAVAAGAPADDPRMQWIKGLALASTTKNPPAMAQKALLGKITDEGAIAAIAKNHASRAAARAAWDAMLALPPEEIEAINDAVRQHGVGWYGGIPSNPSPAQMAHVKIAMREREKAGAA